MKKAFVLFFVLFPQLLLAQPPDTENLIPPNAPPRTNEEVREDIKGTITPPTREQRQNVNRAADEAAKKKKRCQANPQAAECRPPQ